MQCLNCGEFNQGQPRFCRFCGHEFAGAADPNYPYAPPRPYSWKTDEFQTKSEPRSRMPSQTRPLYDPGSPPNAVPGPMTAPGPLAQQYSNVYRGPQDLTGYYRCPNCGTSVLPIIERKVSSAGWITFSLLLVFTIVFFWIGLLMKEDVSVCPVCRTRLNR